MGDCVAVAGIGESGEEIAEGGGDVDEVAGGGGADVLVSAVVVEEMDALVEHVGEVFAEVVERGRLEGAG